MHSPNHQQLLGIQSNHEVQIEPNVKTILQSNKDDHDRQKYSGFESYNLDHARLNEIDGIYLVLSQTVDVQSA